MTLMPRPCCTVADVHELSVIENIDIGMHILDVIYTEIKELRSPRQKHLNTFEFGESDTRKPRYKLLKDRHSTICIIAIDKIIANHVERSGFCKMQALALL